MLFGLLCLVAVSSAPTGANRVLAHSNGTTRRPAHSTAFYRYVQQFLRRARGKIKDLRDTNGELSKYIPLSSDHIKQDIFWLVRLSRDSRANVAQFYFIAIKSPNGLIYVAIYSHICRIVQIAETVCEGFAATGSQHML